MQRISAPGILQKESLFSSFSSYLAAKTAKILRFLSPSTTRVKGALRRFSKRNQDFKNSAFLHFPIFARSKKSLTSKQHEEAALISKKMGVDRLETSTSYLVNYSENGIIIGMDARSHKLPDRQNGIRKTENRFFWGIYAMNLDS